MQIIHWLRIQILSRPWLRTLAYLIAGGWLGSLLLEITTRVAVWQFVPRIYDVQHVFLINIISAIGVPLGATVGLALSPAGRKHPARVGWCALLSRGVAFNLAAYVVWMTIRDRRLRPLADVVPYYCPLLLLSTLLFCYGAYLLFVRSKKLKPEPTAIRTS
jgi:hypothetical protein